MQLRKRIDHGAQQNTESLSRAVVSSLKAALPNSSVSSLTIWLIALTNLTRSAAWLEFEKSKTDKKFDYLSIAKHHSLTCHESSNKFGFCLSLQQGCIRVSLSCEFGGF